MTRGLLGGLVVLTTVATALASSAQAATSRRCSPIMGFEITRDPVTTTCALARSAAVYWAGHGQGRVIYGTSAKIGATYRLRLVRFRDGHHDSWLYEGRAGDARLLVRFVL